jgi:hypothetical protein
MNNHLKRNRVNIGGIYIIIYIKEQIKINISNIFLRNFIIESDGFE